MTYFHTCVGCAEQQTACPVREAVKSAVRGHGITSIRHRCSTRRPMYVPGQRVEVLTFCDLDVDPEEWPPPRVWFPAVVVSQTAGRILAHIKPGTMDTTGEYEFATKGRGYCKSRLSRVRPTSSAELVDLTHCDQCGAIPALGDPCGNAASDWSPLRDWCPMRGRPEPECAL